LRIIRALSQNPSHFYGIDAIPGGIVPRLGLLGNPAFWGVDSRAAWGKRRRGNPASAPRSHEAPSAIPNRRAILDARRLSTEHNFVFRRADGLFYHAKGATPAYENFSDDTNGLTLIPLNMAEPILITRGRDAANGLGFSPHGAGRNFSRSAYFGQNAGKSPADLLAEQAPGIDARYFSGVPDVSELPRAYKNAASMRRQINNFGLAEVVDLIDPIGNIMAGDWRRDAPWRRKPRRSATPAAKG
jgi:hypothetical protein